jgi:tetratricopeptide (TPR) repeat protein
MDETFDVFVSYGHHDADWVHTLAENLHRLGLDVFLDAWEIAPGDVVVHRLERGLLAARNGVLVVSSASVSRPWVQQEYAVMVDRAVAGKQRLIPVLLGDVEVPPFAATRRWVDFRGVDGPEYQRRVRELVAALQGERPQRPGRERDLLPPPGSGFRPEGARRATLRITLDETVLNVDGQQIRGRPTGLSHRLEEQLWQVQRARRHGPAAALPLRAAGVADAAGVTVHGRLIELGIELAEAFVPRPVRAALIQELAITTDAGASLRLGVEVAAPGLVDLPWEALVLPEGPEPLVLHPRVELHRAMPGMGPAPAMQIRGPLRILVVIGSPDQGQGELLDYEAELRRILDAVEPARRYERAYVHILNRGTVAEVRAALQAQRFHVLHVSCHARPGALILEDEDGRPDEVTAERFADDMLVADRGVPLVVLAGCSTAMAGRSGGEQLPAAPSETSVGQGEAALPGLARQLLGYGVPAVLAMNAPVTDTYATLLGARLYQELASQEWPDPLAAVSEARRRVDDELRGAPAGSREARLAELAEWATPVLSLRGPSLPLFDPKEVFERLQPLAEPYLPGMVVRRVGDFVGRRHEQRRLLRRLRGDRRGLVLYGIGGIGKSTLAAQLVHELRDHHSVVVALSGRLSVDQVLDETGRRLLSAALGRDGIEVRLFTDLGRQLRAAAEPWADRLAMLQEHLLARQLLLLVLDNFEENLTAGSDHDYRVADAELAGFLANWAFGHDHGRLVVTSRYPFPLPDRADRLLDWHHLGPLSPAETRKLMWRLPGLDALSSTDQRRAYADVGGHPRTLEYLDGLLRSGQARFQEVTDRIERALGARGIDDPTRWLGGIGGDLDRALAEAVTLAVNDVLLLELLKRLDAVPLAGQLLIGLSVYRLPVDRAGVDWQVGEEIDKPVDADRERRMDQLMKAATAMSWEGDRPSPKALGLSASETAQLQQDLREFRRAPLRVPEQAAAALSAVCNLGLVSQLEPPTGGPDDAQFLVHRWTARALAGLAAPEALTTAHRRAARYWRWQVEIHPGDLQNEDRLLEARQHHHRAGELDEVVKVSRSLCERLKTRGARSWEERLCRETLAWLPGRSPGAAEFHYRLGGILHDRGDYDQAQRCYQTALAIAEELGNRSGVASAYSALGGLGESQRDYHTALYRTRQAVLIDIQVGNQHGLFYAYMQLGRIAHAQGDKEQALRWFRYALAIAKDLGDPAAIAMGHHDLGLAAKQQGDHELARTLVERAFAIQQKADDASGAARSCLQLGQFAQEQDDLDGAVAWTKRAFHIAKDIRFVEGMQHACYRLGQLAYLQQDHARADEWTRQALELAEDLAEDRDDWRSVALACYQLGWFAHNQSDPRGALEWYQRSLAMYQARGTGHAVTDLITMIGNLAVELEVPLVEGVPVYVNVITHNRGTHLGQLRWRREQLGEERLFGLLQAYLDDASLDVLRDLLDESGL